jgi:hypothetical protein
LLSNSFSTLTTNITSNSKRSIQLTEDRQASMSQHPQTHDEDEMLADPTAVQEANAQEFLESLRPLYARIADLDALFNSEVFEFEDGELAPDSVLFEDFDPFVAAPAAMSQQTHDEELIVVEDPNMVLWQDDDIQTLLTSLREENALVNAVYDTEEAVWSDSDSDENAVHFAIALADRIKSDTDTDTLMTDAPGPQSPAFAMPPLLVPTLADIIEKELLRQQTSKVLGTLAPLESELIRLKISDEQEDEERRRKNTCPECGLLCVGKVKLGDHGVEEHGWVVISIEDCQDDERVPDSDDKESV